MAKSLSEFGKLVPKYKLDEKLSNDTIDVILQDMLVNNNDLSSLRIRSKFEREKLQREGLKLFEHVVRLQHGELFVDFLLGLGKDEEDIRYLNKRKMLVQGLKYGETKKGHHQLIEKFGITGHFLHQLLWKTQRYICSQLLRFYQEDAELDSMKYLDGRGIELELFNNNRRSLINSLKCCSYIEDYRIIMAHEMFVRLVDGEVDLAYLLPECADKFSELFGTLKEIHSKLMHSQQDHDEFVAKSQELFHVLSEEYVYLRYLNYLLDNESTVDVSIGELVCLGDVFQIKINVEQIICSAAVPSSVVPNGC